MDIHEITQQQCRAYRSMGHIDLLGEFLLRNGKIWYGEETLPKGFKQKPQKYCFGNAGSYVLKDKAGELAYCEGYALKPSLGMLIHHAWIEMDERVVDVTWRDIDADTQYYGYKFALRDFASRIAQTRYWGMFDVGVGYDVDFMLQLDPSLKQLLPNWEEMK